MTTAVRVPMWPPDWAEVFGGDRFGMFAEFSVEGVDFVMRWIPPGRFLMGAPEDEEGRKDREGPQHWVTISKGFWLGETPVTQAQYEAVTGENPSRFKGAEHPVGRVDWHEAMAFCEALEKRQPGLGARLPSEAQWEYACRAGTTSAYNDGQNDDLSELGWYFGNSDSQTHPVGEKRANAWGLCDMHGNVWEWCQDGRRPYTSEPVVDPVGPVGRAGHAVRGGSWHDHARDCRSVAGARPTAAGRSDRLGFRLAAGL